MCKVAKALGRACRKHGLQKPISSEPTEPRDDPVELGMLPVEAEVGGAA